MPRAVQQSLIDTSLERPVGPLPKSVMTGNNADLIASIADLYLTGSVLDVTYGRGKWWDRFTPDPFAFHDLETVDGVDFCNLPELDNSYDTVCFDPPYVPAGGSRKSNGGQTADEANFRAAYGLTRRSHVALRDLMAQGMTECARVTRGWLLVKCGDYVDGGRFHAGHYNMLRLGDELGLTIHDIIIHATGSGLGGHNIWTAKRSRRAHSYLLVFRKPLAVLS